MSTAIVYHPDYLKHRQVEQHPECPERLSTTISHFQKTGLIDLVENITPEPAAIQDVERVHSREHINYIRCLSERGRGRFSIIDADTYVCSHTYDVALLAAGGVLAAGEAVWKGEVQNAFALIRPPGHHASYNQATGFCYFDNVSIMVKHLQENHGLKRAVIFDWDAHAPNGTMGTFYDDPSVLNMSIHQDPRSFYPGHGFIEEMGEGAGKGLTINFPVEAGAGNGDFIYFIEEFVIPRVRKFKPQIIVISAGQDSHHEDHISQLHVTDAGYAKMTKMFMELADELCGGKLVLELEGGYNLNTLPVTHQAITEQLMGTDYHGKIQGELHDSTRHLLRDLEDALKSTKIWQDAPEIDESKSVPKKSFKNRGKNSFFS
ncbi:MAG TPA: histone deacetylase [Candidatus Altiarchaeales archaeon]|nr:histone deacetylase [Candidatus Altiarchaeales archaeon]